MKTSTKSSRVRKQPPATPATTQAPPMSRDEAEREAARRTADKYITRDGRVLEPSRRGQ
jgi:hypothetical protein